jgi:hypothetical protein
VVGVGLVVAGPRGRLEHSGRFHEELHTGASLYWGHGVPKNFARHAGQTHQFG